MDFNFVDYMRDCATRLKAIGHTGSEPRFFRSSGIANLEELIGSSAALSPCLVVTDNPEGNFEDNLSDNVLDRQYFSFQVFVHVSSSDFSERDAAVKQTKAIALKILGKMKADKLKENKRLITIGIRDMDVSSVGYTTIGPFGDNWWGTDVSFTILNRPDLVYDVNDWEDE